MCGGGRGSCDSKGSRSGTSSRPCETNRHNQSKSDITNVHFNFLCTALAISISVGLIVIVSLSTEHCTKGMWSLMVFIA